MTCRDKPYRAPAPMPAFKYRFKGAKADKDVYDACHLAWRCGVIESWYFGRRSPQDPTVIWELEGTEIARDEIPGRLAEVRTLHGIRSIAWGETWCGYRGIVATMSDGRQVRESYSGLEVIQEAC